MMLAAEAGHLGALTTLVELGGQQLLDCKTPDGTSLTVTAALSGHAEVASYLALSRSDQCSTGGWTALLAAAWAGHVEVVEALLRLDSPHISTTAKHLGVPLGQTPLSVAITRGHERIAEILSASLSRHNGVTSLDTD